MKEEEIRRNMHKLEEMQDDLEHVMHELQAGEEEQERSQTWYRFQLEEQMYYAQRIPFLKSELEEQNTCIQEAECSYNRMLQEVRSELWQKQEACEEEMENYERELREAQENESRE